MNRSELKEIVRKELNMVQEQSDVIEEASEVEIKSLAKADQLKIKYWEKALSGRSQIAWDGIHGLIVSIELKQMHGMPRLTSDVIKNLTKGPDYRWIQFGKGNATIGFTAERS